MKKNTLYGILYGASGSLWWGTIGVIYFKSSSFAGPIELVVHRTIWTAFSLIITTSLFSKWDSFFKIIKRKKEMIYLLITGILIFTNWSTWIYAVVTNKIIDASFGYFIMPILSVFFGILFPIKARIIIGITTPNLSGGVSAMMPNHHITKPVLIGEIQDDGQFDIIWETAGLVAGDAWSDFLPGSMDIVADWVAPINCGNFNAKTAKCSGQNF